MKKIIHKTTESSENKFISALVSISGILWASEIASVKKALNSIKSFGAIYYGFLSGSIFAASYYCADIINKLISPPVPDFTIKRNESPFDMDFDVSDYETVTQN